MPSFQDSAVIFIIALLLFGPKKLPELARQLGKLMAEFRRASNDFRIQMEDELRMSEQAERQKQIAAMEAAAPVTPALAAESSPSAEPVSAATDSDTAASVPIAQSGELQMMPPSTGLPLAREAEIEHASSQEAEVREPQDAAPVLRPLLDSIPEAPVPAPPDRTFAVSAAVAEMPQVDHHG